MKKLFCIFLLAMTLAVTIVLSGCEHTHKFTEWETVKEATCAEDGLKTRSCRCDYVEEEIIPALPHTEAIENGKDATCEKDGYTEKVYCSVCGTVITESEVIEATGHNYNSTMTRTPTCIKNGIKTFTCTICKHKYTEDVTLPKYTATEIFEQSIKYVGEVITYDKNGKELALGSCVVISNDGKILTNYHVIEDAYSAKITINGKEYTEIGVAAYSAKADLALLKISETNLECATVCYEKIPTGSTIYAIGSSKGLTNTYSRGIVTSSERELDGIVYVQHDAAISSGNSGGPLINEYGELVGINTWTVKNSQNLNFAIATSEFSSVTYIDAMTVAEFYELDNSSPYKSLRNWLVENGTYDVAASSYIKYEEGYEGTAKMTFSFTYDLEYDYVYVDLLVSDSQTEIYVSLDLSFDPSNYEVFCSSYYSDTLVNYMFACIDAEKYNFRDLLEPTEYEGAPDAKDDMVGAYSDLFGALIVFFDAGLDEYEIGPVLEDFGFKTQVYN